MHWVVEVEVHGGIYQSVCASFLCYTNKDNHQPSLIAGCQGKGSFHSSLYNSNLTVKEQTKDIPRCLQWKDLAIVKPLHAEICLGEAPQQKVWRDNMYLSIYGSGLTFDVAYCIIDAIDASWGGSGTHTCNWTSLCMQVAPSYWT